MFYEKLYYDNLLVTEILKEKFPNYKQGFGDVVMETCYGLDNFRLNFSIVGWVEQKPTKNRTRHSVFKQTEKSEIT